MIDSENENPNLHFELILIESNSNYLKQGFFYGKAVKVITPNEDFNFHRFLNIGINQATGDFIALCNNDLIFYRNWFSEILRIRDANPTIRSFSPYDETSNKIPKPIIESRRFCEGLEIQKHLTGWCIVIEAKALELIGELDERFNFYYADNDYAMTLRKYNIRHALVCKSIVLHLGGQVRKAIREKHKNGEDYLTLNKDIPNYVIAGNMFWILDDEKMIDGVIKFHKKWGGRKVIKIKLLLTEFLVKYKLGYFNRYILN
jgi:GT2 family glycosyltransferase